MDLEHAVWFVTREHPYGLSKFRLMKILWLAELRSIEERKERLTNASWIRWHFGPFSLDIQRALETSPMLTVDIEERDSGELHRIRAVREVPGGGDVDSTDLEVLEHTLKIVEKVPDHALKGEVYSDPFFQATPKGSAFDFDRLMDYRRTEWHVDEIERLLDEPRKPYSGVVSLVE